MSRTFPVVLKSTFANGGHVLVKFSSPREGEVVESKNPPHDGWGVGKVFKLDKDWINWYEWTDPHIIIDMLGIQRRID